MYSLTFSKIHQPSLPELSTCLLFGEDHAHSSLRSDMESQSDLWVTETQSSLKGVTTARLTGQHSRLRRAKARQNWYNTGVSNDGKLIKPVKFVDQQELRCQNKSKLLSFIRSHVKQDTYMKRQATTAALGSKKHPNHLHILPRGAPNKQDCGEFSAEDGVVSDPSERPKFRRDYSIPLAERVRMALSDSLWGNSPFKAYTGYDPLNRPRALFLLNHYQEMVTQAWYLEAVEACLEWSRSNMILLHAILYCAACHIRTIANAEDYLDIFYHRGEAMKLIDASLEDPVARVSNETIGGLCHLVMAEEMYGSSLAASIHRKGLRRLFELRRTTAGTSMNFIVCHLLPLTNLRLPSEGNLLKPSHRLFDQESDILKSTLRQDPILEVFAWLKETSLQLPTHSSNKQSQSCLVHVKLEYNLYSHNEYYNNSRSRRCWLLASLIYLHTIIATPTGWHLLPKFEAHLINELRNLLEQMSVQSADNVLDAHLHLWILIFGGLHATEQNATWYQEALRAFCTVRSIADWDAVKLLLIDLPWVQEPTESIMGTFYSSVLMKTNN